MVAIVVGMALVFFFYPRKEREEELRAGYHASDERSAAPARETAAAQPATA
jgi:hypothetical protein